MFRWTAKKRLAAKLVAEGHSQRSIVGLAHVNRRSIARWLRRREFVTEVERAVFARAMSTGAFRALNQASEARERAALLALEKLAQDGETVSQELVQLLRDHRVTVSAERVAEQRVRMARM